MGITNESVGLLSNSDIRSKSSFIPGVFHCAVYLLLIAPEHTNVSQISELHTAETTIQSVFTFKNGYY